MQMLENVPNWDVKDNSLLLASQMVEKGPAATSELMKKKNNSTVSFHVYSFILFQKVL